MPATGSQPLLAHYYEQPIEPDVLASMESRVAASLQGFVDCELLTRLKRSRGARWSPARNPLGSRPASWVLDDSITVYCNLDLWIEYMSRRLLIIDWKTGTSGWSSDALQLAVYSLWGQSEKQYDREQVYVQAVHMRECPKWDAKPVSDIECIKAKDTIRHEYQAELRLLEERPNPKGVLALYADREKFPPKPSPRACAACKFKGICSDAILAE